MSRAAVASSALGLAVAGSVALAVPADAATYTVTTVANTGPGSLRQAIVDANGSPGLDVITFAPGVTGTIQLDSSDNVMDITEPVTITGPGSTALTIDGDLYDQAFYIDAGTTDTTTISGLTITDSGGSGVYYGGAIQSVITDLVLDDVALTGNVSSEWGGALYVEHGTLTMTDSTVTGNFSDYEGGGLYLWDAVVDITDSDISGNTSDSSAGGVYSSGGSLSMTTSTITGNTADGDGGGIYADGSAVSLQDVAVTGNTVTGDGGGIYLSGAALTMVGAELSGNSADGSGGGAYLNDADGSSFTGTTISANTAVTSGGGVYATDTDQDLLGVTFDGNGAPGGAALTSTYSSELSATNVTITGSVGTMSTISLDPVSGPGGGATFDHVTVADNGAIGLLASNALPITVADSVFSGSPGFDFAPGVGTVTVTYSLFGTAPTVTDGVDGNIVGVDPDLEPLSGTGGPTETMRPAVTSPVVDAGDPAYSGVTTDQRGAARTADPLTTGTARTDMGAVELAAADLPVPPPSGGGGGGSGGGGASGGGASGGGASGSGASGGGAGATSTSTGTTSSTGETGDSRSAADARTGHLAYTGVDLTRTLVLAGAFTGSGALMVALAALRRRRRPAAAAAGSGMPGGSAV